MSVTIVKSPTWMRISQIMLGAVAIILSALVLANPDVTTMFFVVLLGISLIMVGISKITEGVMVRHLSKGTRIVSVVIGVVSIGGGFFSLAHPMAAIVSLIMVINIFILIHGAGLIGNGIASRKESRVSRIANVVIGGIVVSISVILSAFPALALVLMVLYLSIGILLNGMGSIISGITGHSLHVKTIE